MSGNGQFQVHQRLDMCAIEVEYAFGQIEQTESGNDTDDAEHGGDAKHHVHVPCLGLVLVVNIIIGDRQDRTVVEQRGKTIMTAVTG